LREAVFLWSMPFDFALLMVLMAASKVFAAASLSFALTDASTAFVATLIVLFAARLRTLFASACRALFSAERFLFTGAFAANVLSSLMKKSCFIP
jgi:hypothetical protein